MTAAAGAEGAGAEGAGGEGAGQQNLDLGGGEAGWRECLDAELQGHPGLADIPDVPTLTKNFLEAKAMVGRKGIILPKDGDAADRERFNREIGVPETVEGYDLGDFTPPEGLPWNDGFQTAMLGKLHALGIPNGQIRQLFDDYAEVTNEQYQGMLQTSEQGHTQAVETLKTELGADYNSSIALSKRAFKAAAGDQFDAVSNLVLTDGTKLGDNPSFVKTFINIGKQYQEHGLAGEKTGGGGFTKTPETAKQEIAELESHEAWRNADHPEHGIVQAKMNELYKFAYPEQTPEVL